MDKEASIISRLTALREKLAVLDTPPVNDEPNDLLEMGFRNFQNWQQWNDWRNWNNPTPPRP